MKGVSVVTCRLKLEWLECENRVEYQPTRTEAEAEKIGVKSRASAQNVFARKRDSPEAISAARLLLAQPLTMTMRYTRCQVLAQIASFLGMLQQCFRDGSVA